MCQEREWAGCVVIMMSKSFSDSSRSTTLDGVIYGRITSICCFCSILSNPHQPKVFRLHNTDPKPLVPPYIQFSFSFSKNVIIWHDYGKQPVICDLPTMLSIAFTHNATGVIPYKQAKGIRAEMTPGVTRLGAVMSQTGMTTGSLLRLFLWDYLIIINAEIAHQRKHMWVFRKGFASHLREYANPFNYQESGWHFSKDLAVVIIADVCVK